MPNLLPVYPRNHYRDLGGAVGGLILAFGRLETYLAVELRTHLKDKLAGRNSLHVACAIYGSMRFKDSRDTIKRLMEEEAFPEAAVTYFNAIASHVGHIQDLRDKLAHHSITSARTKQDGVWKAMDAFATRRPADYKIYEFETSSVLAAVVDLRTAADRLVGFMTIKPSARKQKFDLEPPAWRYKPSMLKLVHRKSGTSRG